MRAETEGETAATIFNPQAGEGNLLQILRGYAMRSGFELEPPFATRWLWGGQATIRRKPHPGTEWISLRKRNRL